MGLIRVAALIRCDRCNGKFELEIPDISFIVRDELYQLVWDEIAAGAFVDAISPECRSGELMASLDPKGKPSVREWELLCPACTVADKDAGNPKNESEEYKRRYKRRLVRSETEGPST